MSPLLGGFFFNDPPRRLQKWAEVINDLSLEGILAFACVHGCQSGQFCQSAGTWHFPQAKTWTSGRALGSLVSSNYEETQDFAREGRLRWTPLWSCCWCVENSSMVPHCLMENLFPLYVLNTLHVVDLLLFKNTIVSYLWPLPRLFPLPGTPFLPLTFW